MRVDGDGVLGWWGRFCGFLGKEMRVDNVGGRGLVRKWLRVGKGGVEGMWGEGSLGGLIHRSTIHPITIIVTFWRVWDKKAGNDHFSPIGHGG